MSVRATHKRTNKNMNEKLIDEQIERFEREITILQGCISTLICQKTIQAIKDAKRGQHE